MRPARPGDEGAMAAFLTGPIATSMFLLSNLQAHGVSEADHPHATRFWLREDGGRLTGVFGRTLSGLLMAQMPGLTVAEARGCLACLDGAPVKGMSGDAPQVRAVEAALGRSDADWTLRRDEPLFALDLSPDPGPARDLRPPAAADAGGLAGWVQAYEAETGLASPGDPPALAAERAQRMIAAGSVRLLLGGGRPVAMANANAVAGPAVQVGGVFVPPALRGQGRAGRVVAGLLAERAAAGAQRAFLFAASDAAARAYVRIGFQRIGLYRVALLRNPVAAAPAP